MAKMARKPKAAKVAEGMADMPENLNTSTEKVGPELNFQPKSVALSTKKALAITRRSGRIKNVVPAAQHRVSQEMEPKVEINLCESEKEDEPHVEEIPHMSIPTELSLEEKVNYLFEAVEELKSKETMRHFQTDSSSDDHNYKSLYIESQKKIEALTKENLELAKKLDVALGKIEVFEAATPAWSKMLGNLNDMIFISDPSKAKQLFDELPSPDVFGELDTAAELKTSAANKRKACQRKQG